MLTAARVPTQNSESELTLTSKPSQHVFPAPKNGKVVATVALTEIVALPASSRTFTIAETTITRVARAGAGWDVAPGAEAPISASSTGIQASHGPSSILPASEKGL